MLIPKSSLPQKHPIWCVNVYRFQHVFLLVCEALWVFHSHLKVHPGLWPQSVFFSLVQPSALLDELLLLGVSCPCPKMTSSLNGDKTVVAYYCSYLISPLVVWWGCAYWDSFMCSGFEFISLSLPLFIIQENLQQLVLMTLPNVLTIAKDPLSGSEIWSTVLTAYLCSLVWNNMTDIFVRVISGIYSKHAVYMQEWLGLTIG